MSFSIEIFPQDWFLIGIEVFRNEYWLEEYNVPVLDEVGHGISVVIGIGFINFIFDFT